MSDEIKKGRAIIQIARPMGNDPGAAEVMDWQLIGGVVQLIDSQGRALPRGKERWERSLREGEDPGRVARELLWARYRATRRGSDFNRPLHYRPLGVA
jgi:hypothetical protein